MGKKKGERKKKKADSKPVSKSRKSFAEAKVTYAVPKEKL